MIRTILYAIATALCLVSITDEVIDSGWSLAMMFAGLLLIGCVRPLRDWVQHYAHQMEHNARLVERARL